MTYDMHVHVAESARSENATDFDGRPNFFVRLFLRQIGLSPDAIKTQAIEQGLSVRVKHWIETCRCIDRFVLLALDAPHDDDGQSLAAGSFLVARNSWVSNCVSGNSALLFGASIHPYRADALQALDQVLSQRACLAKWIPSWQRIRLDDVRCIPFYEKLAEAGLPLLVHTGNEHGTGWSPSRNHWNAPELLRHPLRRGVKVIAAHCGARLFLHERCYFQQFCHVAAEYENLYGDISAFGVPTRISALRKLLKAPDLSKRIMYGSDFPAFTMPRWFMPWIGFEATRRVTAMTNPFERAYQLMHEMGVPDAVFKRAGQVLRL